MVSVLSVCTGNICRSPTAEGVFRAQVEEVNLTEAFLIDSAGTHDYHVGRPPDARAQHAAMGRGIDIGWQRARHVEKTDFEAFDYILAMDQYNIDCLSEICPLELTERMHLLLDFADNPEAEVPDPYHGGSDGFDLAYDLIEEASAGFLKAVIKKHSLSS